MYSFRYHLRRLQIIFSYIVAVLSLRAVSRTGLYHDEDASTPGVSTFSEPARWSSTSPVSPAEYQPHPRAQTRSQQRGVYKLTFPQSLLFIDLTLHFHLHLLGLRVGLKSPPPSEWRLSFSKRMVVVTLFLNHGWVSSRRLVVVLRSSWVSERHRDLLGVWGWSLM